MVRTVLWDVDGTLLDFSAAEKAAVRRMFSEFGLGELMDGIFLYERLGVEKPNTGFFEKVFAEIRPDDLSAVMIVGDSLTSDIKGGINAGITTCW